MIFSTSFVLLIFVFTSISGLNLPMTNKNGGHDMVSIVKQIALLEQTIKRLVSHETLMEQTITSLHRQVQATTTELKMIKDQLILSSNEVATAKTQQKTTEDELTKIKADLRSAEADVSNLKYQLQDSQDPTELSILKTKTGDPKVRRSVSQPQINLTVIDVISADVKSNMKEIQSLKTDLLNTQRQVNITTTDLQTLQTRYGNMASQVVDTHTRLFQTIHDVQAEQGLSEQDLAATKSALQATQSDVKSLMAQMNAISSKVTGQNVHGALQNSDGGVAFQVTQRHHPGSGWTTLRFDTVDYSTGGGYNDTSGIFTAPVPGTYIFWAKIGFYRVTGYVYINKGQQELARGYYRMQDLDDNGVAWTFAVTHLDKGDEIHFTVGATDENIANYDSTYGGALLHPV